jgi:hypothetical protein
MRKHSLLIFGAVVLSASLVLTQKARAFAYPLGSEEIREAYFLGRTTDNEKIVKFFDDYIHKFPYPSEGPYVESVEFRTPYEQVVLRSRARLSGYDPLDASKDYAAHPELVIVRIVVFATRDYSGPVTSAHPEGIKRWSAEDFFHGFLFRVEQNGPIKPKKIEEGSACGFGGCSPFPGSRKFFNSTPSNLSEVPQQSRWQRRTGKALRPNSTSTNSNSRSALLACSLSLKIMFCFDEIPYWHANSCLVASETTAFTCSFDTRDFRARGRVHLVRVQFGPSSSSFGSEISFLSYLRQPSRQTEGII